MEKIKPSKICKICKLSKSISMFYKNKDGLIVFIGQMLLFLWDKTDMISAQAIYAVLNRKRNQ